MGLGGRIGDFMEEFPFRPGRLASGVVPGAKDFEGLFAAFPGPLDGTLTDLEVTVGGDVGYGHSVQRVIFTDKDGKKLEVTFRVTDGYKKVNGQWLISHEHVSLPVDLATLKPDLNSK